MEARTRQWLAGAGAAVAPLVPQYAWRTGSAWCGAIDTLGCNPFAIRLMREHTSRCVFCVHNAVSSRQSATVQSTLSNDPAQSECLALSSSGPAARRTLITPEDHHTSCSRASAAATTATAAAAAAKKTESPSRHYACPQNRSRAKSNTKCTPTVTRSVYHPRQPLTCSSTRRAAALARNTCCINPRFDRIMCVMSYPHPP